MSYQEKRDDSELSYFLIQVVLVGHCCGQMIMFGQHC